jgi:hypothetical protein
MLAYPSMQGLGGVVKEAAAGLTGARRVYKVAATERKQ